eukprot:COSAG01_NODE_37388_length_504_cov_0.906173_1_plen_27_part_10
MWLNPLTLTSAALQLLVHQLLRQPRSS